MDQARYLAAARAWSGLDLSPEHHHYLPLYPLLGAAFIWLTPWQPFMVPDLLCLLASLFLFVRIARRLTPATNDPVWTDALSAICFTVAVVSGKWVFFWLWVVPWTSSGSAPFQFACVLLALRFGESATPRRAFPLSLCIGLVAGFRPSDAGVLAVTCGGYAGYSLARCRATARVWAGVAGMGTLGLAVGVAPWMAAHAAIFGMSAGPYVQKSAAIGFEWRLLPLRWVMLVIDPRPLLPEGAGIAEVLPWVIPGVAGMLLGVMPRRGTGVAPAALAAATVTLHWALYLTYRDLQPYGLWRFVNVHYFKWTFPFFVLWAAQFAATLARRGDRRLAGIASVITLALVAWRPVLRDAKPADITIAGRSIDLPQGLVPLNRAELLPLSGSWRSLYFGLFTLQADGTTYRNTYDFKVLPVTAGALVVPLRRLPTGSATLDLPDGVSLGSPAGVRQYTQAIEPGLPCGILPRRRDCAQTER